MSILPLNKGSHSHASIPNEVKDVYQEYKTMFHLSRNLVETKDVTVILERFIGFLKEIVSFSALGLLLKEKYSDDFYLHYEHKITNQLSRRIRWLERTGYIDWVCTQGRVSIIPNDFQEQDDQSMVIVPLLSGKQVIGVLVIFLELATNDLTSRLSDLLFLLGSQAAVALENAYLYQDMELKNIAMNSMKNFLENSLESMADGLFAIDLEDKISLYNSSAATYLGGTPVQAIGSDYHRFFSDDFASFLDKALRSTFTTGSFEDEFHYRNPMNKKVFPLGIHLSTLKNGNGDIVGVIAVCRDLTERQEIIHLKKLDSMKDEFISAVSHELRTPLTGIKSFTEILLQYDDHDTETQREFLTIIEKETNRLIDIVNDLLDLGRMSEKGFALERKPVNIEEVLQESLKPLNVLAESRNLSIVSKLDRDLLWVIGDFNRLIQVFVNLIGNAIKFSPDNSEVVIRSQKLAGTGNDESEEFLQIAIQDQGVGIPKEYHKTIFEKFKQFSYDKGTKPEGSGLGLPICKKIITKLGGEIWVESAENQGSIFYFTLPLAESQCGDELSCKDTEETADSL